MHDEEVMQSPLVDAIEAGFTALDQFEFGLRGKGGEGAGEFGARIRVACPGWAAPAEWLSLVSIAKVRRCRGEAALIFSIMLKSTSLAG